MKCLVDDFIYAVLGHTQLSGNLILGYSSVMNIGNCLLVVTVTGLLRPVSSSRLSLPRLNSVSPSITIMYAWTEIADIRLMVDVDHIIRNDRCSMFNYL